MQPSLRSKLAILFGNWLLALELSTLVLLYILVLYLIKSLLGSKYGIGIAANVPEFVNELVCFICCVDDNDELTFAIADSGEVDERKLVLLAFVLLILSNVAVEIIGLRIIEVVSNWLHELFVWCKSGCWLLPHVSLSGLLILFTVGFFNTEFEDIFAVVLLAELETVLLLLESDVT